VLLSERLRIGRREACGTGAAGGGARAAAGDVRRGVCRRGSRTWPRRWRRERSADRHAALICRTIDGLPDAALEQAGAVEATLVEHARTLNPDQLAVLTRTVRACLDPDGCSPPNATTTGTGTPP
jgi:hypothetical protein